MHRNLLVASFVALATLSTTTFAAPEIKGDVNIDSKIRKVKVGAPGFGANASATGYGSAGANGGASAGSVVIHSVDMKDGKVEGNINIKGELDKAKIMNGDAVIGSLRMGK